MRMRGIITALIVLIVIGGWGYPADAQVMSSDVQDPRDSRGESGQDIEAYENVEIDPQFGERIPKDLVFQDEDGNDVKLSSYFDGTRPVVLHLVYHDCPMLCGVMTDGMTETLQELSWAPGDEFEVLTVSFNHRETPELARERKAHYLNQLDRPGAEDGWHFLTGSEESIEQLTEAVGYRFQWIESRQEYAHPPAAIFLSGEGTVSRYLQGVRYPAGDMRRALVEASEGQVGSALDQVVMYCFQYDPDEGSYTADVFNLMIGSSALFAVLFGGALVWFWRRERRALEEPDEVPGIPA